MSEYTAIIKQSGDWWIGWIEEAPGVNCQESTRETLIETLREAIELNRAGAQSAAGGGGPAGGVWPQTVEATSLLSGSSGTSGSAPSSSIRELAASAKMALDTGDGALQHRAHLAGLQVPEPFPAELSTLLVPAALPCTIRDDRR
jgi:predicted RNase H-like HicB family nuclease